MPATKFGNKFRQPLEFIRDWINNQLGDDMTKSELTRNSRRADYTLISLNRVITRTERRAERNVR